MKLLNVVFRNAGSQNWERQLMIDASIELEDFAEVCRSHFIQEVEAEFENSSAYSDADIGQIASVVTVVAERPMMVRVVLSKFTRMTRSRTYWIEKDDPLELMENVNYSRSPLIRVTRYYPNSYGNEIFICPRHEVRKQLVQHEESLPASMKKSAVPERDADTIFEYLQGEFVDVKGHEIKFVTSDIYEGVLIVKATDTLTFYYTFAHRNGDNGLFLYPITHTGTPVKYRGS